MKKVAIIGNGWVGKGMRQLFPNAIVYVRTPDDLDTFQINNKEAVNQRDIAFICVPSPVIGEGKLDTSIVEECIAWCECPLIVVRSTVNPGDCNYWSNAYHKRIVMQPEYLGETPAHPLLDTTQTNFLNSRWR